MTVLDDRLVPKTKEILHRLGKSMDLSVVTTPGTYNDDGSITGEVEATQTVTGSPPIEYSSRLIDGDVIKLGDVQVFLAALGLTLTPAESMKVTFDGEDWKAVTVKKIYSGDLIALWELQLRR